MEFSRSWVKDQPLMTVSNNRKHLSLSAVQDASSEPVYKRGVQYYRRKKVLKYEESDDKGHIVALVIGSEPQPYRVEVNIADENTFTAVCSCPYFEPVCKHSVAVLLTHIAKVKPGIRFDVHEGDRRNGQQEKEKAPKAKDYLEDPYAKDSKEPAKDLAQDNGNLEEPTFELGLLVLEKPLALIVGIIPEKVEGKVNILKVPPEVVGTLEEGSRLHKLASYLTDLPQTTKGQAGGHRIPRGDEGLVLGHLSLCAKLINTADSKEITFSKKALLPRAVLSETENGEILFRLEGVKEDGSVVSEPVFFMGQSSWVMADHVLYPININSLHKLFPFFDSYGQMTVKLDLVTKFLGELSVLKKKMAVVLDESVAPFPTVISEPPKVVIQLNERRGAAVTNSENEVALEVMLGFQYGDLILSSRDETSAVEEETYTRTISENGASVWVRRLWDQESQIRLFLNNLHPEKLVGDRFFFEAEPALEVAFYLSDEQSIGWNITGWENLSRYKVKPKPLTVKAKLSLKKDSFKFGCDLLFLVEDQGSVVELPQDQVFAALFKNKAFIKTPSGEHVRLPIQTLFGLLKSIGQGQDGGLRPLYQALSVLHALETHEIPYEADKGFQEFVTKIHNFHDLEKMEIPANFQGQLREYQKDGCNWLGFMREYGLAGVLADDMGLGKTIQTLALLSNHYANKSKGTNKAPSLVVAPTSVIYNWLSESKKFTPELNCELFMGRDRTELLVRLMKDKGKTPDVVFTTYGIIRRDYEELKKVQFEYVILDEAQNIKNPESVGAVASKSLKSFHRLALSGTPIENRLKELWSLYDFLMPDFLGNYKDFNDTFERPIEAGLEGAGLKLRKIVHPFMLRRLKNQVEKDLPERTDIVHLCELDDEQRSIYLDVLDECREKVFADIGSRGVGGSYVSSVLAALLRLRQVCCDPRLLKNREIPETAGSAKLETLMHMIRELIDEKHKILIFSQFVEMLTLIRKEFEKTGMVYEYLDGQTPAKDRLDKVNKFNADPDIPVFLISLKAGGTGLNLTGADYVIHYDPWWNPAVENQATDRAHRIGQTKHVFNYKLITRGTVEEKILGLQKKKKELAELVVGGDQTVAKELTREDLEFLFSF